MPDRMLTRVLRAVALPAIVVVGVVLVRSIATVLSLTLW